MELLNLVAKITLDSKEYEQGLKGLGGKAKNALGGIAKIGTAAIAVIGTAAVAIGKQAIDAYADYEQLAGGIETLYTDIEGGTQAVDAMMEHASEAWKTAGMSANEYMETAIASSASLINSLGGDVDKAAELMDMSIVDMADNVNKMGTTMEAVQNAYRGFSRGNFTMLDNLALGFAGTKEGMQELLDKAQELSGIEFDISSYSDIVQAIHIVQEEMGIAGTTAKEASETIQGSLNAMKSAWTNLLTGIADENADVEKLVEDLSDSIVNVAKNIIPRIQKVLKGATKAIKVIVQEVVPMIVQMIIDNLPMLVSAAVEIMIALATGLIQALPQLIAMIPEIINAIVQALKDNWPALKEAGKEAGKAILVGLVSLTYDFWAAVEDIFNGVKNIVAKEAEWERKTLADMSVKLAESLDKANQDIVNWFVKTSQGLKESLDNFANTATSWFKARVDAVIAFFKNITDKIKEFYENVKAFFETLINKVKELAKNIYDHTIGKLVELVEGVKEKLDLIEWHWQQLVDKASLWGQDLIMNFVDGIAEKFPHLAKAINWVTEHVANWLGFSEPKEGPLSNFHTYAPDMMKLFAQGIKDNEHLVTDQIGKSFDFGGVVANGSFAGSGSTTNTYNITVNGIEELEDLLNWYQSRQVRARMA